MEPSDQNQIGTSEDVKGVASTVNDLDLSNEQGLAHQGEAIDKVEKEYGLWQALTIHKRIVLYLLASYTTFACYGYDTIANGASLAMPSFLLYYGHVDPVKNVPYLDSIWTSLWSSMTGLGQVLGAFISGPLSHRIGRRYSAMAFGCVAVVGVALQFTASSKGLLLAGKMINGFAVGGLLATGSTYASEISPPRLRNVMLGGLAFFAAATQTIALGIVRSLLSNTEPSSFRLVFALQWVVGVLPIIAFFLVPESPSYLVLKGRYDDVRKTLTLLYGKDNSIDARLAHLRAGIEQEEKLHASSSYLDCFRGTNLKRTLTVCLIVFGPGLAGSAFLQQNIYFLVISGLPVGYCFDVNIGGFALGLLCMPLAWRFGDRVGRRPLYLVGIAVNAVVLAVVGALGYAPSSNTGATWAIAILLNVLITWQILTVTHVSFSLPPEISSYRLRHHTQSINVMVQAFISWFFPFVTPYMYNIGPHSGALGAKTGFVYMGTCVVLLLLAHLYVPDIRGLSTDEVDYRYEKGVNPRNFAQAMRPETADQAQLRSKESSLGGS